MREIMRIDFFTRSLLYYWLFVPHLTVTRIHLWLTAVLDRTLYLTAYAWRIQSLVAVLLKLYRHTEWGRSGYDRSRVCLNFEWVVYICFYFLLILILGQMQFFFILIMINKFQTCTSGKSMFSAGQQISSLTLWQGVPRIDKERKSLPVPVGTGLHLTFYQT